MHIERTEESTSASLCAPPSAPLPPPRDIYHLLSSPLTARWSQPLVPCSLQRVKRGHYTSNGPMRGSSSQLAPDSRCRLGSGQALRGTDGPPGEDGRVRQRPRRVSTPQLWRAAPRAAADARPRPAPPDRPQKRTALLPARRSGTPTVASVNPNAERALMGDVRAYSGVPTPAPGQPLAAWVSRLLCVTCLPAWPRAELWRARCHRLRAREQLLGEGAGELRHRPRHQVQGSGSGSAPRCRHRLGVAAYRRPRGHVRCTARAGRPRAWRTLSASRPASACPARAAASRSWLTPMSTGCATRWVKVLRMQAGARQGRLPGPVSCGRPGRAARRSSGRFATLVSRPVGAGRAPAIRPGQQRLDHRPLCCRNLQCHGWKVAVNSTGEQCITQEWKVRNFRAGLDLFQR
jgi:hypothetical protein